MKIYSKLILISGLILLFSSSLALAQEQSLEEAIQMLELKRNEIASVEAENDALKVQLEEHEVTIAEYKEMIELLDEEVEQLQMQLQAALEDNS